MGSKRQRIRSVLRKGKITDPKYLASCYGKIKFSSYEEAKANAETKPSIVKPYRCQYGKHYHVGRRHKKS